MHPIPISVSPEAADHITETLLSAQCGRLTPALYACEGYTAYDEEKRLVECYSETFFNIGYDRVEAMTGFPVVALGISGLKMRAAPNVLQLLEGKHLVLRMVNVGPKGKTLRQPMLKAVGV
jgi:hypothetical protein